MGHGRSPRRGQVGPPFARLDAGPPPADDNGEDETGTDPRGFSSKFMPYYRHTELDNDLEVDEAVMFGMVQLG